MSASSSPVGEASNDMLPTTGDIPPANGDGGFDGSFNPSACGVATPSPEAESDEEEITFPEIPANLNSTVNMEVEMAEAPDALALKGLEALQMELPQNQAEAQAETPAQPRRTEEDAEEGGIDMGAYVQGHTQVMKITQKLPPRFAKTWEDAALQDQYFEEQREKMRQMFPKAYQKKPEIAGPSEMEPEEDSNTEDESTDQRPLPELVKIGEKAVPPRKLKQMSTAKSEVNNMSQTTGDIQRWIEICEEQANRMSPEMVKDQIETLLSALRKNVLYETYCAGAAKKKTKAVSSRNDLASRLWPGLTLLHENPYLVYRLNPEDFVQLRIYMVKFLALEMMYLPKVWLSQAYLIRPLLYMWGTAGTLDNDGNLCKTPAGRQDYIPPREFMQTIQAADDINPGEPDEDWAYPDNPDLDTGDSDGETSAEEFANDDEGNWQAKIVEKSIEKARKKERERLTKMKDRNEAQKLAKQKANDKRKGKQKVIEPEVVEDGDEDDGNRTSPEEHEIEKRDQEFTNKEDLVEYLKKSKLLSRKYQPINSLKDFTRREGNKVIIDFGVGIEEGESGEVEIEVGENGEIVDVGQTLRQKNRLLCPRVRQVVEQIYNDVPHLHGKPIKLKLQANVCEPSWFTTRGDLRHDSPLRNYTAEEVGIHSHVLDYLDNVTRRQGGKDDYQDPHKKADGTPTIYGPRKTKQTRVNGRFASNAPIQQYEDGEDYNPFGQNMQAPLIVKASLLYAIKQNLVSAKDLGMGRIGKVFRRLKTAATAIIERQLKLEEWVNEQRSLINLRTNIERKAKLDMHRKAKAISAQNEKLIDWITSDEVKKACADAGVALPDEDLLNELPTDLRVRKTTSTENRTALCNDRRTREQKLAFIAIQKDQAPKPTLDLAEKAIYGSTATGEAPKPKKAAATKSKAPKQTAAPKASKTPKASKKTTAKNPATITRAKKPSEASPKKKSSKRKTPPPSESDDGLEQATKEWDGKNLQTSAKRQRVTPDHPDDEDEL